MVWSGLFALLTLGAAWLGFVALDGPAATIAKGLMVLFAVMLLLGLAIRAFSRRSK